MGTTVSCPFRQKQKVLMTFRVRLLSTYLFLFVVVIAVLSIYVYKRGTAWNERTVIRSLTDETALSLDAVDDLFDRLLAAMESLDKVRAWTDGSPVDYVNDRLQKYCDAFGGFDRITLYDEAGTVVADSGNLEIGRSDPNRSWQAGIAGKSGYRLDADSKTGSYAFYIYRRVTSRDGQISRVLVGRVPLAVLGKLFHGFRSYGSREGGEFDVTLVATGGILLHATQKGAGGSDGEWNGLRGTADKLWRGGQRHEVVSDSRQITMIALPQRRGERETYPWVLRVTADKDALYGEVRKKLGEMALFGIFLGGCSSLVIWFLARNLSRPVEELVQHVTLVARGDFTSIPHLSRRTDEFGLLFDSFISMGERLHKTLSELRASQEMYRSVIETTPNAITVASIDGFIIMANQHSLTIFGNDRVEDVIGRHLFEWVSPTDREMAAALLGKVVAGEMLSGVEINLLRGEEIFIGEVSAVRVKLGGEKEDHLIVVTADITDRKCTEQQICHLNEELEILVAKRTEELNQTNKELAGFCYAISHELRAPVARLQGFSRVLREDCAGEEDRRFCSERIDVASRQLQTVIDAILMLSRLSRLELNFTTVDLTSDAREIVAVLQMGEHWNSHEVTIQEGMHCQGDADLLHICLENLLGNAVKYSSRVAGPRVAFGMEPGDVGKVFYVKDNGAGFDMAFADKLFVPFQRLHQQDEFPGTGIGLATVQRILERHGGRIWAEGKEGEGATFFFTLNVSGKD